MLKEFFIELINKYGYLGIFIIGFTEPIFQPFPVEIFITIGIMLGLDWKLIIVVSTLGSVLGGMVTYFLGIKFGEKLMYKLFDEKKIIKGREFLKKWGILGVIIASFTPIPFEIICWVCASFEMPFNRYILAIFISRLLRHTIVVITLVFIKNHI